MKYGIFKGLLFCGCMMSVLDSEGMRTKDVDPVQIRERELNLARERFRGKSLGRQAPSESDVKTVVSESPLYNSPIQSVEKLMEEENTTIQQSPTSFGAHAEAKELSQAMQDRLVTPDNGQEGVKCGIDSGAQSETANKKNDLAYEIAIKAGLKAADDYDIVNIANDEDRLCNFMIALQKYANREGKKVGESYQQIYEKYWAGGVFLGCYFSDDLKSFTGIYTMQYYVDEDDPNGWWNCI